MNQFDQRKQGFLRTQNLVKRFDDVLAVDDVSISIQKGEIFALLGLSLIHIWMCIRDSPPP